MTAAVFYNDINETATLTTEFTVNPIGGGPGVPTDPSTVTCTVTDPAGNATVHTYNGTVPADISRTGIGAYQLLVPCTAVIDGIWYYEWDGTGTASAVAEGTWTVTSITGGLYCTVEELKSRLQIGDTADDFEVTLAVQAACRNIDEITGRYFWRGNDVRTYIPEDIYYQSLDDLVSVTTLKVDRDGDGVFEETWTQGTDYALQVGPGKYNPAAKGEQWPYTAAVVAQSGKLFPFTWVMTHLDRIQVTGVFGWPAVPLAVKQAALIASADLFRLKDAPFGVAGSPDIGLFRIGQNSRVMSLLTRYINGQRVGV